MSYNNVDPSVVFEAVRDTLLADMTLNGATCLGSSGRIFTRRAPSSQTSPFLVIECKGIQSAGIGQFFTEVRVYCYTLLLSNGQIDPKGDVILNRCQEVLNDQQIVMEDASVISLTTAIVPSFFDSESDDSKARGVLRVNLTFGNS
jgi:hypothetical protein